MYKLIVPEIESPNSVDFFIMIRTNSLRTMKRQKQRLEEDEYVSGKNIKVKKKPFLSNKNYLSCLQWILFFLPNIALIAPPTHWWR
jgi:hypothetical protein